MEVVTEKNNQPEDGRTKIVTEKNTSCLTIESVNQSDAGKMSVCLTSSIGTDQASANICIEDVPGAPVGKPQVYDIGRNSASLSWCGPASSGGSQVTYYSIEAKTRHQKTWDVIVPQCKELSYHILDLKPATTYQFRVRAANKHGLGAPSEASERVITSDPLRSPSDYDSEDDLPFEPKEVKINTKEKFEDLYTLEKEVGKGKFGVVYKCKQKKDDTVWAAKIVKCREKDKDVLRQEVDIMNKLRHPKLLLLWDAYESPRQMVLVMEYVGAGELFERVIGEDFVLTERDCTHFLRQICEGVAYMHERSILHLDLKPENILCIAENSNRIKIIDFGLARVYNPEEKTKVLFGTPEFIAPEVINYEEIGFATDMWSVGVICYVLLSGLSPFLGDSDAETLASVTSGEFDFDDEAFDEISDQAKDFISKLLVKKKEDRMLTDHCLAHNWLNQDDVDGMRYKRLNTERLKRFMVRRKWLKTGNAVLAVSRLLKSSSLTSFGSLSRSNSNDSMLSTPSPTTTPRSPGLALHPTSEEEDEDEEEAESQSEPDINMKNKSGLSPSQNLASLQDDGSNTVTNNIIKDKYGFANQTTDQNDNQLCNRNLQVPAKSESSDCANQNVANTTSTAVLAGSAQLDESSQKLSPSSLSSSPPQPPSSSSHATSAAQSPSQSKLTSGNSSNLQAPVFTKSMKHCEACAGDVARFDVIISGEPAPQVTWFFEDEEIHADSRHTIDSNERTKSHSLIIRSIEEDDEGEYTCKAVNSQGEITCAAELSVLEI